MNINNIVGNFLNIPNIPGLGSQPGTVKPERKQDKTVSVNELKKWRNNEKLDDNGCPKWDIERIPLKYYINKNMFDEKFLPDFIIAAKSSFIPWSRASYGLIRFQETLNKKEADIIINWSNIIVFGRDLEVGHTDLNVVNNRIEKAEITVIIYPIIDRLANNNARVERVRRTVLHEIGHSLGLNHSNSDKDVMHHRGINNKNLSANDIKRFNELYNSRSKSLDNLS